MKLDEPELLRGLAIRGEQLARMNRASDRLFGGLLLFQWLVAGAITAWLSPFGWHGTASYIHPHVWLITVFGGIVISLPLALVRLRPGHRATRHTIAASQMILGALLIHVTGGRVETHFHVFGSLAFLAFYRDWRVLVTATLVVTADHLVRGFYWPESIYGIAWVEPGRTLEHVGWVMFEDVFLFISVYQSRRDMLTAARQQAELEAINLEFDARVHARTRELRQSEDSLRKTTALLQQQKSELRVLFDFIPAMICFKDSENRILRTNASMAEYVGKSVTEIEGRPAREIFPAMADKFYADDLEVLRSGVPKLGIMESFTDHRGQEVRIRTDKVPVRDEDGRITGLVAMAQDITARIRDEETLRLLGHAIQQSTDSVVITNRWDGKSSPQILFVNSGFCAMTGYTAGEVIGKSPLILAGPQTERAIVARMRDALVAGETLHGETINYRKNGSSFLMEWQVAPIRDDDNVITHCIAVQRDITQRKAAELELVRSREAALEASRLKSRFLANMSHELRTPLNTINGLSATLLEQDLPAHLVSPVSLILQCGESLLQNIQTILTHASLESGKFSLESRPFSPADVALTALRITGERARRKGLVLDFCLDPAMPSVVDGDAFRLQQVLVNFLANAIKFTDRGRVCLRVRALRSPEGRVDLRFIVADTGLGIPAGEVGALFEPFAQADSSGQRRFEGTGLGLAISKTLVDLMGGSIGVRSRTGRGSFFFFTVPFLLETLPRPLGAAAHASLADREVLIEEPRPLRRRMLAGLARAWRMRAKFVDDAAGFATAAARWHFDFAIRASAPTADPAAAPAALPVVWLCPAAIPAAQRGRNFNLPDLFSAAELSTALNTVLTAEVRASAAPLPDITRKLGERIPLRILSADDIATNRDMLRFMCRHLGYSTDLVVDGVELLERVAAQPYDLLLIDVNMPRMDGLAAARELCRRQPDPAKRPRLVAVTANALAGDRERCLAAGMDDYLAKPLIPKNLVACIERLFTEKPAVAPARPSASAAPVPVPPLVDLDFLGQITAGLDPAEAAAMIGELSQSVIRDYAALREPLAAACTARQARELEKIVHGLKGCFLSTGWTRVGGRCAAALAELRTNRFTAWDTLAADVHTLEEASAAELTRLLAASALARDANLMAHPSGL